MLSMKTCFGLVWPCRRQKDTARFGRPPVDDLLPQGILDTDWIPIVGVGWVVISNDRHLRTRPVEAELAVAHKLKVVHLHGRVGGLVRVGTADAAGCAVAGH